MKENNKQIWFKQRRYGYGWTPNTWQGWLVVAAYIVLVVAGVDKFLPEESTKVTTWSLVRLVGWLILWTALLFRICLATGGKPKWRWGKE